MSEEEGHQIAVKRVKIGSFETEKTIMVGLLSFYESSEVTKLMFTAENCR